MRGASNEDAAARYPPRVNSAFIRVYINGQELLALLDTGCEVDLVSEETTQRCNLPVHSLAQSLRLWFADGRQNARIGKVTGVKCQFQSEMGTFDTVWDFYVGPVHHGVILGMPWVTQWKARMGPLQAALEVCAPGDDSDSQHSRDIQELKGGCRQVGRPLRPRLVHQLHIGQTIRAFRLHCNKVGVREGLW